MKNYKNLISILTAFMEDMWLPYEDSYSMITRDLKDNEILLRSLITGFIEAVNDSKFNWIDLAVESQLLISPDNYSNKEIKNYVQFLLQDYLFPEKVMTKEEIMVLDNEVQKILKKHEDDNGCLYSYDVYDELIKLESYKNLEYYNLWKLLNNGNIENRCIDGKDRDIGYLRLTKN